MKIALDTNVLVAAFITHGACHELLEHCVLFHEIVLSQFILDEFQRTLLQKFTFKQRTARKAVQLLRTKSTLVKPISLPKRVCRDADDDHIIATAVAGNCDCIVSGDKDLLALRTFQRVIILSPNDFWGFESESGNGGI